MWCLARTLPILIGELVSSDDDEWLHYLQLLTCVDYIFAPVMTEELCDYLAVLIEDFLTEFKELYNRRLIPTMHYMIHIPTCIKK